MNSPDMFLTDAELKELTGRTFRRLQIEQLRRMLIPFHINALGKPVVVRAALVGQKPVEPPKAWSPRVVNG